jgi:serine/threonine protein kinase
MEFVEGETLEKLIKRSGQIQVKLALGIAMQVAAGLSAVHKQAGRFRTAQWNVALVGAQIAKGWVGT